MGDYTPFKMKGSPAKRGIIQGTAGHSALKLEKRHTNLKDGSYITLDENMTARRYNEGGELIDTASSGTPVTDLQQKARKDMGLGETGGGLKDEQFLGKEVDTAYDGSRISKEPQKAYGGDRTWAEAQRQGKESGFDLNQTTRDQKAYEKEMLAQNPNWNKREDNEWKRRQNSINAAVGSKKVYDVESDAVTDLEVDQRKREKEMVANEEHNYRGRTNLGEGGDEYGAALDLDKDIEKSSTQTDRQIARQRVKDARAEFGRGSDEVKAAKAERRKTRTATNVQRRTGRKDRRFVDRDEALERRIQRRKDKGRDTSRLEAKKQANLEKQKAWDEGGQAEFYQRKMKKHENQDL